MSEISREEIHAFADNRFDCIDHQKVASAIEADPALKAEYEAVQKLKAAVGKLEPHTCEETLAKCKERVREIERTRRTEHLVGKYSYAMATVLLVAILAAAYVNRSASGLMGRDMVSRTLSASAAGADVSGRSDSVVQWLRQQLRQDPERLTPSSLRLEKIERVFIDGRMIGRLVYTDGVTQYLLVIVPGSEHVEGEVIPGHPGMHRMRIGDLNAVSWCQEGASYALVAPKPIEDLVSLVR